MVKVLDTGFLTTYQDRPRTGLARYGLSESGPMAPLSFWEANYVVGNREPLPSLEVTMKPPRLLFQKAVRIGLAGADFGWKIDGRPVGLGQGIEVRAGSTLQGDYCRNGLRGYIGFGGGIQRTKWSGSAATHVQSGLGGGPLRRGEEFSISKDDGGDLKVLREHPGGNLTSGGVKILRVVEGPHASLFPPEAFSLLCGGLYRVTEQSSRMALRLEGLSLPCPDGQLVSCGAWHGAIQVPASGIPQILGCEHPATGGYPLLASVIRADFEVMGQLRPREEIRLGRVSVETAIQVWKRQREWWRSLGWQC